MSTDDSNTITLTGELVEVKPVKRPPLVPERIDLFEGDEPAEQKVSAFLASVIPAAEEARGSAAGALVAWVCDVLLSEHSVKDWVACYTPFMSSDGTSQERRGSDLLHSCHFTGLFSPGGSYTCCLRP